MAKDKSSVAQASFLRKKKETSSSRKGYSPEALTKIRDRAYFIWENKGRVDNSDLDNWLEAERGLRREAAI